MDTIEELKWMEKVIMDAIERLDHKGTQGLSKVKTILTTVREVKQGVEEKGGL